MSAQHRSGQAYRRSSASIARQRKTGFRYHHTISSRKAAQQHSRSAVKHDVLSIELLDEEFDELECRPETLLRLANQT